MRQPAVRPKTEQQVRQAGVLDFAVLLAADLLGDAPGGGVGRQDQRHQLLDS